jgi:glycosyltransferase involved in cell wall biosynthesis
MIFDEGPTQPWKFGENVKPTISVITISFNDIAGLRRTRESVEAQKDARIEHIIVDGGSTDGTQEYLSTLDELDWSSYSDNGRYDAMNRGIERANTDLIWLMHAGDTFGDANSVEKVLRSYSREKWSWAYGFSRIKDLEGNMIGFGGFAPFDIRRFALGAIAIPHQATIFERKLHEQIGGYDEEIGLAADQLYMLRLAKIEAPYVIGEFLCNFDGQGAGSIRGRWAHLSDMSQFRKLAGVSVTGNYTVDRLLAMGLFVSSAVKAHLAGLTPR